MAHEAQRLFFKNIKDDLPEYFDRVNVVYFGSKDYNGSLKSLFTNSEYIGVDISPGRNVDVVSRKSLADKYNLKDTQIKEIEKAAYEKIRNNPRSANLVDYLHC